MKAASHYVILLIILVFVLPTRIFAQTPYKVKTSKQNVAGTSSLHDWVSDATQLEWSGSFQVEDKRIVKVKDVLVTIPVKSIKSTKGGTMDKKTYEALKSDKNPAIVYNFSGAKISGTGPDFVLETKGTLQMAGTSKSIEMSVAAKLLANGDIQLTGSKKLNMKDFAMEPPTAVLGTIKVGPEVTVNFDLTISPGK